MCGIPLPCPWGTETKIQNWASLAWPLLFFGRPGNRVVSSRGMLLHLLQTATSALVVKPWTAFACSFWKYTLEQDASSCAELPEIRPSDPKHLQAALTTWAQQHRRDKINHLGFGFCDLARAYEGGVIKYRSYLQE